MPASLADIEKHLWDAADELRANSKLKSAETSKRATSVVGTCGDAPTAASAETPTHFYSRAARRSDVRNILHRLAKD